MGLRTSLRKIMVGLKARYHLLLHQASPEGSRQWLIAREQKYGGLVTNVPRIKVSSEDPRSQDRLADGGMTGGDRMLNHGYADKYSECFYPFLSANREVTLVECGILKGTGLAMWCDLFPDGHIVGLDIDLGHTQKNMENLKALGAFKFNRPELFEFDQFADNTDYLGSILRGDAINIFIDDGFHSVESILNTMKCVIPHLSDSFVYIVEDNKEVHAHIRKKYPNLSVDSHGELTIVSDQ